MSKPRAARRALARAQAKLARSRERLAMLEPGGAADRPLEVASASEVEVKALSTPCPSCEGPLRLEEHAATTVDGARLRVARLRCARCGGKREIWFRLGTVLPS